MNHTFLSSIFILIVLISPFKLLAADPPPKLVQEAKNSFICIFKDNVPAAQVPGIAKGLVQEKGGAIRHIYTTAIKGFSANMPEIAAQNIARNKPNIAFCEPNGMARGYGVAGGKGDRGKPKPKPEPAPEPEPEQHDSPQITPYGIEMVGGPGSGIGLTAWIIDSGIDLDHPDLNVDISRGRGFVRREKSTIDDGLGHGTHVAGILAAIDNDIDVVGVAAGANVVPVRVLNNDNWALFDAMIKGIDYVAGAAQGGDVANMSIWAKQHHEGLHQAAAGLADIIPFVVIAGNDGQDINTSPSEPAHVQHYNLYTVSAVYIDGHLTGFSNYGAIDSSDCSGDESYECADVDIAAPGAGILSLQPGGGLAAWDGTSMAAPHVAGVILLRGGNAPTSDGFAADDPDSQTDPIVKYIE